LKTPVLGGVRSAKSQLASALDVAREVVEPGPAGIALALEAEPLLDLGMRQSEGSGARSCGRAAVSGLCITQRNGNLRRGRSVRGLTLVLRHFR
jgi:NaMN:DMB phosphoribosyltransferase